MRGTVRDIMPKTELSLQPTSEVVDFEDPYIIRAIADLKVTFSDQQRQLDELYPGFGGGVGLASNQMAYPVPDYPEDFIPPNLYAIHIRPERAEREGCSAVPMMVLVNVSFEPVEGSEQISYEEGCLSIVGFKGYGVPRYENIIVRGFNEQGEAVAIECSGFEARVHQHEIDHGAGGEYLNRMNFSHEELHTIKDWIRAAREDIEMVSDEVIPEKLECNNKAKADLGSLEAWVDSALKKFSYSPRLDAGRAAQDMSDGDAQNVGSHQM